jgi:hypothetical protein
MADRILFIGWRMPVKGREERAIEVFNESVGLYGRLQQEGRIEGFAAVFLASNPLLGGFFQLHGTAEQLFAVREDEAFQRSMVDAELSVDGMHILEGYTGDAIAGQMGIYTEAVAKVPQMA